VLVVLVFGFAGVVVVEEVCEKAACELTKTSVTAKTSSFVKRIAANTSKHCWGIGMLGFILAHDPRNR
jgi:hypothetical protein